MIAVSHAATDFRVAVHFSDTVVVAVAGELDAYSAPNLDALLGAVVDRGSARITLDCAGLSFIDAAGLRTLVTTYVRLGSSPGVIRVRALRDHIHRTFEIAGLVDVLHAERQDPDSAAEVGATWGTGQLALHTSRLDERSARAEVLADVLAHITELVPSIITGCDGASITLRHGEQLITAASSNETVRALDGVQYVGHEGPCVDAAAAGVQIHVPALVEEDRWVRFTTQARARGMESVLSSPLSVADRPTGALNLYSRTAAAFVPADQDLATAVAMLTARLLDQHDQTAPHHFGDRVRDAINSRDSIALAQGILMARHGIDAQDAYEALRRDSVRTSIPIRVLARDIVERARSRALPRSRDEPANG